MENFKYQIGDRVEIVFDDYLKFKTVKPPVEIGEQYVVKGVATDREGNQHLDVGIPSEYNFITSFETGEELPGSDKIHYIHPSRVKLIK